MATQEDGDRFSGGKRTTCCFMFPLLPRTLLAAESKRKSWSGSQSCLCSPGSGGSLQQLGRFDASTERSSEDDIESFTDGMLKHAAAIKNQPNVNFECDLMASNQASQVVEARAVRMDGKKKSGNTTTYHHALPTACQRV